MNKYLSDVMEWGQSVREEVKEICKEDEILSQWETRMSEFLEEIREVMNEQNEEEIEIDTIHNRGQSLYNDLKELIMEQEEDPVAEKDQITEESPIGNGSEIDENRISNKERVSIGEHTLPPLPYEYNALEPYIEKRIMKLHHQKHHQSYVEGLNKAEKMLAKARKKGDFDLLKHWERELAFHGSGHYLHTIFWNNMTPNGGGKPTKDLLAQIEQDFGSFDAFKKHFTEAAKQAEGVGWAILVWSPRSRRLEILQAEKHQLFAQWDVIPLLVLDVWEHAYYLQYENERGKYVNNWWNVVNWNDVDSRFEAAKKLKWKPF